MVQEEARKLLAALEIEGVSDADLSWLARTRGMAEAANGGRPSLGLLLLNLAAHVATLEEHGHLLEDAVPGRITPAPHWESIVVAIRMLRSFVPGWAWSVRGAAMWDAIGTNSVIEGRDLLRKRIADHPEVQGLRLDLAGWLLAGDGRPPNVLHALDALDLVDADARLPSPPSDGPFTRSPPKRFGAHPTLRHAAAAMMAFGVAGEIGLTDAGARQEPRWRSRMKQFVQTDMNGFPWASQDLRTTLIATRNKVAAHLDPSPVPHTHRSPSSPPAPTSLATTPPTSAAPAPSPGAEPTPSPWWIGAGLLLLCGAAWWMWSPAEAPPETPRNTAPPPPPTRAEAPQAVEALPDPEPPPIEERPSVEPAPEPEAPAAPPAPRYTVRLSHVDDHAVVLLGDRVLAQTRSGRGPDGPRGGLGDTGRVDVTDALRPGRNVLTFRVTNDPGCCNASATLEVFDGDRVVAMLEHAERTQEAGLRYEDTVTVDVD